MHDSDWSRKFLLRSDWSGPSVASTTTHTDTLDHLKEWGKVTKKKSLSTYAIAEMLYMILIMNYRNLLITTLFFFGPPTKNIV